MTTVEFSSLIGDWQVNRSSPNLLCPPKVASKMSFSAEDCLRSAVLLERVLLFWSLAEEGKVSARGLL